MSWQLWGVPMTDDTRKKLFRAIIPRVVVYGALAAFLAYTQAPLRCFYNPFEEDSLIEPCVRTAQKWVMPVPQRVDALFNIATELHGAGNYPKAAEVAELALATDPSRETNIRATKILNDAGDGLMRRGAYQGAISVFTKILANDSTHRNALNQRGYAYQNTRQFPAAAADYTQMIGLFPADKAGYGNRAGVYMAMRRYREAVEDITAFLKFDDKDTWMWSSRAEAKVAQFDYAGGLQDADMTLSIDPKHRWAHETKVTALVKLRRYNDALAAVDMWEAAGSARSVAVYDNWRATAHLEKGAYKAAVAALDRAIAVDRGDAWALRQRGYIKWQKLDDVNGALPDLERAIALGDAEAAMYKSQIEGAAKRNSISK